jgi:hypothetical protein
MIVQVLREASGKTTVRVLDADDCGRLHVAADIGPAGVDAALAAAGVGRLADDTTAMLDAGSLRRLAEADGPLAADWPSRWAAMLDNAGQRGWVRDGEIQAHVEHS